MSSSGRLLEGRVTFPSKKRGVAEAEVGMYQTIGAPTKARPFQELSSQFEKSKMPIEHYLLRFLFSNFNHMHTCGRDGRKPEQQQPHQREFRLQRRVRFAHTSA